MMEIRRIRVGMMGMQVIRVAMWGIGVGMHRVRVGMREIANRNKGNYDENVRIGLEMMNKKCGER